MNRAWPCAAIAFLLLAVFGQDALAAEARQTEARLNFDLPAGNAAEVLLDFSEQISSQTTYSVLFDFGLHHRTNTVRGSYSPLEALAIMTKGTGLTFGAAGNTLFIGPPRYVAEQIRDQNRRANTRVAQPIRMESHEIAQEFTITGSRFRTDFPGANLVTIDREELLSTGSLTVAEAVRTLPQVFGGGPTEDTPNLGREAQSNSAKGVGLNLRGLGAGATVPLVNGRRMAPGGEGGMFVDVLSIPLIAVERIDVVADGSTGAHGSDAIGGTINFVLREAFEGNETSVDVGSVTRGSMQQYRVAQVMGNKWDKAGLLFAFERYRRDHLAADARAQVRSDLRRWGGDNFDSPNASPPNIIAGGIPFAIRPRGDGSFDLVAGEVNLQNRHESADAMPAQDHISLYTTAHYQPRDRFKLSFEGFYTERDALVRASVTGTALPLTPLNPYYVDPTGSGFPVVVNYSFLEAFGPVVADAKVQTSNFALRSDIELGGNWLASARLAYASETQHQILTGLINFAELGAALLDTDPATAFNPFGPNNPATIAKIRSASDLSVDADMRSADVRLRGPVKELPGGTVRLDVGVGVDSQTLDSEYLAGGSGTGSDDQFRNLSRKSVAGFAQLVVPLIGERNRRPGIAGLELSALARYEDYERFAGVVTPRLGLTWKATEALSLRGTWGESFRVPNMTDLFDGRNGTFSGLFNVPDAAGVPTPVLVRFGNNPSLRAETATSWTAGLDFASVSIPGFSIGATFFDIKYRNRIIEPLFPADALTNPDVAELVTFDPSLQLREQLCSTTRFMTGPIDACLHTPIAALVDTSLRNLAVLQTRGIDVAANYPFDTRIGTIEATVRGTYIFDFKERIAPGSPLIERVDTQNNPIDFRLRSSLSWERRLPRAKLKTTLFLNYADNYEDTASQPGRRVRSMTTADLNVAYVTDPNAGNWLANTRLALHVENLWDEDPPFLNNHIGIGYDQENADILGRVVRVGVQKFW